MSLRTRNLSVTLSHHIYQRPRLVASERDPPHLVPLFPAVLGCSMPESSSTTSAPTNLLSLDEKGLAGLVKESGWPAYRTGQILRWLYQRRARTISQMTDLSQADRAKLASVVRIGRATNCTVFRSSDQTRKLILTLEDGLSVE